MTRRPVLAPGLTVLQRTSDELQIGLTGRHRLRVADTPAVRRTLAVLTRGEAPRSDPETRQALRALAPALRDGDMLGLPGITASEVAAVGLLHPRSGPARLRARRSARIAVLGSLGSDAALDAGAYLSRSGLGVVGLADGPDALLVLSAGPVPRDLSDELVRNGVVHLVVEAVESELVVGPFVVPGSTACVRCLDAHRSVDDPWHPALVGAEPEVARRDGVPSPLHAAMATLALSWAAADMVRYAEGDRPATWSATVTVAPDRSALAPVPWLRHPACGCSWSGAGEPATDQGASATMSP